MTAQRHDVAARDTDRSIGALVSRVTRDLTLLVRQEIALAKAELRENLRGWAKHAVLLGAGAALAGAGFLTLIAAMALGLVALGAPAWLAVLLLAVVLLVVGVALVRHGAKRVSPAQLVPRLTAESVKESVALVKEQV
jgi:hypothetical protein